MTDREIRRQRKATIAAAKEPKRAERQRRRLTKERVRNATEPVRVQTEPSFASTRGAKFTRFCDKCGRWFIDESMTADLCAACR